MRASEPVSRLSNRLIGTLKQAGQYRPPTLILLLWGGMVGAIASQWILSPEPVPIQLLEIGVPLLLVLPLLYTARYVTTIEPNRERQYRILLMSLLFMIIASGTVALIVLSELAAGGAFKEMLFPLIASSSAGVGVGSLAGLNYGEVVDTRRELEAEVEQTRRLNQRLTVINRVLRHNVRNTLALVLGTIDTVAGQLDESGPREKLQRCRRSLESLHSTAENALQIEHLQARKVEDVEIELAAVIEQTREQIQAEAPAATIQSDVPPTLTIRAHPLLSVAIRESLQNAITHNDTEGLTVDIDVTQEAGWITITISDNGSGIPVGEVESLNLDEETPLHHASGVGLWLVKWIAEASDGRYTIRSPDGEGTTIQLRLPTGESDDTGEIVDQ